MLQLIRTYLDQPVYSLRTGGVVAHTLTTIINPNNLKIEGFFCADSFSGGELILLVQDIRDVISQGIVIDDHDVLAEAEELIRLQKTLKIQFELVGKPVLSESKKRIGKVNDYAVDDATLYVQKIYVAQNVLRGLNAGQLAVDRDQIIEITNKKIVIKDPLQPVKAGAAAPVFSPQ